LLAVDVVTDNDWVLRWSWGDVELDLGVCCGELRKDGLDEAAAELVS
jgi:hypothetical protein